MAEHVHTLKLNLGKLLTVLLITASLISGAYWLFGIQATAQRADQNAATAIQKLDSKADKQDLQEMKQDIREIRDCVLLDKCVTKAK